MDNLNGRIPLSSLTLVDGWAYLEPETARRWGLFCDEIEQRGFARPTITAPDGAYRNIEGQIFWKKFWTKRGKSKYAAAPGTSPHGLGRGIDIWNVYQYPRSIVESVAEMFGLEFNVSYEPWHMRRTETTLTLASSTATPIGDDTLSAAEVAEIKAHITAETERLAGYVRREARLRLYRNNQTEVDGAPNPRFGQIRAINISTGVDYPIRSDGQLASLRLNGYSYIGDGDFDSMQQVDDIRFRNIVADCAKIRKSLGGSGDIPEPDPFA